MVLSASHAFRIFVSPSLARCAANSPGVWPGTAIPGCVPAQNAVGLLLKPALLVVDIGFWFKMLQATSSVEPAMIKARLPAVVVGNSCRRVKAVSAKIATGVKV